MAGHRLAGGRYECYFTTKPRNVKSFFAFAADLRHKNAVLHHFLQTALQPGAVKHQRQHQI